MSRVRLCRRGRTNDRFDVGRERSIDIASSSRVWLRVGFVLFTYTVYRRSIHVVGVGVFVLVTNGRCVEMWTVQNPPPTSRFDSPREGMRDARVFVVSGVVYTVWVICV